jgi:hypothetical protein
MTIVYEVCLLDFSSLIIHHTDVCSWPGWGWYHWIKITKKKNNQIQIIAWNIQKFNKYLLPQ